MADGGKLEIIVKDWGGSKCLFKRSRNKEGAEVETLICNCTAILLASDEATGEYLLQLEGAGGRKVARVVSAIEISHLGKFREIIRPYSFLGGQTEMEYLMMFWHTAGLKHKLIHLKNYMGKYADDIVEFWVLADRVQWTKRAGVDLKETNLPDEVISIGEAEGWTGVRNLCQKFPLKEARRIDFIVGSNWYYIDSSDESGVDMELQTWPAAEEGDARGMSIELLLEGWGKLYGNVYMAYLLLGWFCGIMYIDEVMGARGSKKFPLFALSGLTQSGKTSLIGLFMRFWGVQARPSDYTQVSTFADLKQLQMANNFPIWRDEYRNVGRAQEKEPLLRSLYDRSSVYRGTASQELKSYNTSGTFLLSGEGVTIDPAIRRRFVYFEMQDKYKLTAERWRGAEEWANDYAPELFYRAIEGGFNQTIFKKLLGSERNLDTVNDAKEEKVCIAALGAVFGEELGDRVMRMGEAFWAVERVNFDGIDKMKTNIAENFFTFVDSLMITAGGYMAREYMGVTVPPAILNYMLVTESVAYIKLTALIQLAYDKGFGKLTTLDAWAVKSAIKSLQKGKDRSVRMGGLHARVVAIPLDDIEDNMALSIIVDNVAEILGKVRANGRTLEQDGGGEVEELDEPMPEDAFLLLQSPEGSPLRAKVRRRKRGRKFASEGAKFDSKDIVPF